MTHCIGHITDHPHLTALLIIDPKIIVGHTHNHPTNLQGMNHADQVLLQLDKKKATPQEEHEGEDRRPTN